MVDSLVDRAPVLGLHAGPGNIGPASDPDVHLLVPDGDVDSPEVSIVIPAVNEELTVSEFLSWCHEGLRDAGAAGEIIIVDSSTDRTPELALAGGARVLRTPKRGVGRAYIDALPYVRGKYVIMGDADCTYDFRKLAPFVNALRDGVEYANGSRWKGSIERKAMPPHHQYFGSPLTCWMLNRVYGSHFTDIHCGMRGITTEALYRMGIEGESWEYASEMVLKSVRMGLRTTEVPVTFYKDRNGRISHHKRVGWFSPFYAAWINMRSMFVHGAEFFLFKPGIVLLALGLLLTLPLSFGGFTIGPITFNLYWMMLGLTMTVLGLQSVYFGCLAQVFLDPSGRSRQRWRHVFRYSETVAAAGVIFAVGFGLAAAMLVHYLTHQFSLPPAASALDHLAITGLLLMIVGFSTFCFTLLLHATDVRYGQKRD